MIKHKPCILYFSNTKMAVVGSDRLKTEDDHLNIEKVAALLLFIMPAHRLVYGNLCHGKNINIYVKCLPTLKCQLWIVQIQI